MSTINDILVNVKQNLGNRSSGVIGGTPVDTVVLVGINYGFKNIIKLANPTYYDRVCSLALTSANYKYDIPTTDIDTNTIKVKQITGARLFLTGETASWIVNQITMPQWMSYDEPSVTDTGVPSIFAFYQNKLWFTTYPDTSYTLKLAVNIIPQDFAVADLYKVLGVDDIWIETIEAYATHYCFSKLQQTADALFWKDAFNDSKRHNKGVQYKHPFNKKPVGSLGTASDPLTDPFVQRFNS